MYLEMLVFSKKEKKFEFVLYNFRNFFIQKKVIFIY